MKFCTQLNRILTVLSMWALPFVFAGEEEFYELQQKLEADVLELRSVAEQAFLERCDVETLERCYMGNYHGCYTSFPEPECMVGEEFHFNECSAQDSSCSARWDYSASAVRYPSSSFLDEMEPAVVESICSSQAMDGYFISKTEKDRPFWEGKYGVNPPWMHFGSTSGVFRIFPLRPQQECSWDSFDCRLRPWYVAGSSGPKNVVLLLDTSGSMDGLRLQYMKEAAIRVIDTLTIGDRVAVVPFSSSAEEIQLYGNSLVKVTEYNKNLLKQAIQNLQARGSTNIYEAFRRTFNLMVEAIPTELVVNCNTAILFLTDGRMTDPPELTEPDVLDFVQQGLKELEEALSQKVFLFTYSISENDDVHTFPKQLACSASSNGVWSKIIDDRNVVESLSSYYKLFSMGLGDGRNEDFTAWVEPYVFATNGIVGITDRKSVV